MMVWPTPPTHPLTIDEYAALGEDEHGRTELQEGSLIMSPSPSWDQVEANGQLLIQLASQVPRSYAVLDHMDIDLRLVPDDHRVLLDDLI